MTIAWHPYPGSSQDGYVLELDDGNHGPYRVSCGILYTVVPSFYGHFSRSKQICPLM